MGLGRGPGGRSPPWGLAGPSPGTPGPPRGVRRVVGSRQAGSRAIFIIYFLFGLLGLILRLLEQREAAEFWQERLISLLQVS